MKIGVQARYESRHQLSSAEIAVAGHSLASGPAADFEENTKCRDEAISSPPCSTHE